MIMMGLILSVRKRIKSICFPLSKKLIRFETNQLLYMLATVDEAHKINILLKMKNIRILSFHTYDTIVWTTKKEGYDGICRRITENCWSSPFNFSWCCCTRYK